MLTKIKALVFGHAVADALGVPVEFKSRAELAENPVSDVRGYGTYNMPPGSWSDDTSMTLALMDSIARLQKIDYADIMQNFLRWLDESEFTPTGKLFDIGNATREALYRYKKGRDPLECGGKSEYDNGNGSLMRISPMACWLYAKYGADISAPEMERVHNISALTHRHPRSLIACGIYVEIAVLLLAGNKLKSAIEAGISAAFKIYAADARFKSELAAYDRLQDIDSLSRLPIEQINSTGYVVDTLEAVIYCLLTTDNYKDCVLKAINLGDDTDTVGAITGGLSGLVYGIGDIPKKWQESLLKRDYIDELCVKFYQAITV